MRIIPSRRTDPITSHLAERQVAMRATSQKARLLKIYAMKGRPLIDEEAALGAGITHPRSCPWKRCSELREMGFLVYAGGYRRSSADELCQTSKITEAGWQWLRDNHLY